MFIYFVYDKNFRNNLLIKILIHIYTIKPQRC